MDTYAVLIFPFGMLLTSDKRGAESTPAWKASHRRNRRRWRGSPRAMIAGSKGSSKGQLSLKRESNGRVESGAELLDVGSDWRLLLLLGLVVVLGLGLGLVRVGGRRNCAHVDHKKVHEA